MRSRAENILLLSNLEHTSGILLVFSNLPGFCFVFFFYFSFSLSIQRRVCRAPEAANSVAKQRFIEGLLAFLENIVLPLPSSID